MVLDGIRWYWMALVEQHWVALGGIDGIGWYWMVLVDGIIATRAVRGCYPEVVAAGVRP